MSKYVDWFSLIAIDRGMPTDWRWFRSEVKGEKPNSVFLIEGAVPGGVFARGRNKGKFDPKKYTHRTELVVTHADLKARRMKWEQETGDCSDCYGAGKQVTGVSVVDGNRVETTAPCRRCTATGKAKAP